MAWGKPRGGVVAVIVVLLVAIIGWRVWVMLKPLGPGFHVQGAATSFGRAYMEAENHEAGLMAVQARVSETHGWSYAAVPCEETGGRRVVATLELWRPSREGPIVPCGRVRVTAKEVAPMTGFLFTDGHSDWFLDASTNEDFPAFAQQDVAIRLCIVAWRE